MTTSEMLTAAGLATSLLTLLFTMGGGATWKLSDRLARLEEQARDACRRLNDLEAARVRDLERDR